MNYRIYGQKTHTTSEEEGLIVAIDLSSSRATSNESTLITDDNLIELELEGGIRLMLFPDELEQSPWFKLGQNRDSAEPVLVLADASTRGGLGGLVKFMFVHVAKKAGQIVARLRDFALSEVEARLCPNPRVMKWNGATGIWDTATAIIAQKDPVLLLIHGTFSSTEGSFGALWQQSKTEWARLVAKYRGEVYALEHRTLAHTPVSNAIDALNAFGKGLQLDLMTHSRGGLVAELLAQAVPTENTLAGIHDQIEKAIAAASIDVVKNYEELLSEFKTLTALKREKQISVRRIARVACPARGTTLLSPKRLRNWLSLLRKSMSAAQWVAPNFATHMTALIELTKAVVLNCIKPHEIPGFAAMDPGGVFIRHLINHPNISSASELAVVASDMRGTGLLKSATDLALDVYFGRSNDWVVDCDSMVGGAQRLFVLQFRQSGAVMHTQYFGDPRFATAILGSLLSTAFSDIESLGFKRAQIVQAELRGLKLRQGNVNGPVLFVLPGIMGSHLAINKNRIWIDFPSYVSGGFGKLRIDQQGVSATDLVASAYQDFVDEFSSTHEVIAFPYDWRKPLHEAGVALNAAIAAKLKQIDLNKRPIQIVAHSMGGMVVRAMLNLTDNAWNKAKENASSRIIMLGTPNKGAHAITEVLTGRERTIKFLDTIDLANSSEFHVGLAAAFPGALDLLPVATDEDQRDYFSAIEWQPIGAKISARWPLASATNLDRAKKWRAAINEQALADERVFYIAGHAAETPSGVDITGTKLRIKKSTRGDGRVLWNTGIPHNVPTWYAKGVAHGDLPDSRKVQIACREILATARTELLSKTAPEAIKPGFFAWLRESDDALANYSPSALEFERSALARSDEPQQLDLPENNLSSLSVRVCFGHLKSAKHPLFVGHYQGDGVLSAERAIDGEFKGALSARHELDDYPGAIGTHLCILGNAKRNFFSGAVVAGLGEIGGLRAAGLTRTVRAAVIGFASSVNEQLQFGTDEKQKGFSGLSFLLIGSGAAGLSIHESARAILQGVHEARQALVASDSDLQALKEIEFVELYKDRAHTLWDSLTRLLAKNDLSDNDYANSDPLSRFFQPPRTVDTGMGGRTRLVINESSNWWLPLKIQAQSGRLVVENLESRARSELNVVETDQLVQALVKQAIKDPRRNVETEFALFELLLPTDIKDLAPDAGDLRLLLTPAAAAYPWELIADRLQTRRGNRALPQSVRVGVVRQLSTISYRSHVRHTLSQRALIVSDPQTNGQLVELPGAQREGDEVEQVLRAQGWQTTASVRETGGAVIRKLFCDGYRIIHFAGHGVDDVARFAQGFAKPTEPEDNAELAGVAMHKAQGPRTPLSGLVVGDGEFITSKSLEQLRELPTLVFINCCHLGVMVDQPQRSAAQFAQKFIELGVKCVIAAGWAVDDLAASTFAAAFYAQFLSGATFGNAVREARKQTFLAHSSSNTFAAYQCYGDPAFVLVRDDAQAKFALQSPVAIPSSDYLIDELLANSTDFDALSSLQRQVESSAEARLQTGRVYAAFAQAFERLGKFEQAATFAKKAIDRSSNNSDAAGFDTFTRWINLESRFIEGDTQRNKQEKASAIRELMVKIEHLVAISPTAERYGLLGATARRLALVTSGATQLKALNDAFDAYSLQRGYYTSPSFDHIYACLRQHLCEYAMHQHPASKLGKTAAANAAAKTADKATPVKMPTLQKVREECAQLDTLAPVTGFWNLVADTHAETIEAIIRNKLSSEKSEALNESYQKEFRRAKNEELKKAIIEQIDFLETFTTDPAKAKSIAALLALLKGERA